jgi:carboxyl-terminal processing protease
MYRSVLWILIWFVAWGGVEAKAPDLSPLDVKSRLEEILRLHVACKKLTPELIERILVNFINELDPTRCYFLEGEIDAWLHPSEMTVQAALDGFARSDFSIFEQICLVFEAAIARRGEIESQISMQPLPLDVQSEEFKDMPFAQTQEELFQRCLRVKALQVQIAERFNEEERSAFLSKIQKRRLNRESEWQSTLEEKQKQILSNILKASAESLDAHTNYFTPSEASQFMIQVQQRLFGVGAQLKDDLDGFTVTRILENSPASLSGKLRINDKIIAVNHEPVIGLDIVQTVDLIRGEKGACVTLTVLRETRDRSPERLDIELIRNEVILEDSRFENSVEAFGDGVIAHMRLFSFYQDSKNSSALDMRKSLEILKKEHCLQGIILDLRSNAGGLLPQAVAVTGLFINKGIVVSIKDNSGKLQHLRETEGKPAWDGPLIVLTNRASASAAEIVAQTLQDYGRAIVVGDDHTFGKGTFQTCTLDPVAHPKISPQGEYKVTRGRYYTVSGKSPQLTGVFSDIIIPGMLSSLDIGEKFEKYPLENDQIEAHFDDDLSDLSAFHRLQLGPMYRYNLQTRLTTYQCYLNTLKINSKNRIAASKPYQRLLQDLKKSHPDSEAVDFLNQDDLQELEARNIMKDLIFLMRVNKGL